MAVPSIEGGHPPAPPRADLVSRSAVIALLRREMLDLAPSTPGGQVLVGDARDADIAYRRGHNARAQSLIDMLSQGDVLIGLAELRRVAPAVLDTDEEWLDWYFADTPSIAAEGE